MPLVNLTLPTNLECGCQIELWKLLLYIAETVREDNTIQCPAHGCILIVENAMKAKCLDFLNYLKSNEGRARFPFVYTPVLKFPQI